MAKTKVVLNNNGFYGLRTSPEMVAALANEASTIAVKAGEGFRPVVNIGGKTSVGRVIATTNKAARREAKYGVLSKAMGR